MTKRAEKRKRVGLALGGGAVRGMAHIGVLEVLERERIPVDVIAGTSVGALVGALYCAGMSAAELAYIGSHFRWSHFARPVWSRYGLVSFEPIGTLLTDLIGDITFDQLDMPFAAVAADIDTGEMVTLDHGPVAPAVVASSSVPGLVVPVELNGRHLCDGGIVNNLPVSVARDLGADYIIAVDIFEPKYGRHKNPLAMGFLALEILIDRAGMGYESADCLIKPALAGRSYHRFDRREELHRCGVNACETILPQLRAALRELDLL